MALEPITRREFSDPDRSAVQDTVVRAVEADSEVFIDRYHRMEQSLGGRYVSADLFKETFEAYRVSKDARHRYNTPVHNAAAVLAAEQLRRVLRAPLERDPDSVVLLTGIPGSGKTSSVLAGGAWPSNQRAVYEGQLANFAAAAAKMQQILEAGLHPVIVAVHATPERALANTLQRFDELGRGAGIGVMASIQGTLPDSLQAIRERFGEEVKLQIIDRRNFSEPNVLSGWSQLSVLQSEGNYEQIRQRLTAALEQYHIAGRIGVDAYRQALGQAPRSRDYGLDSTSGGGHEIAGHERERAAENRQETFLTAASAANTTVAERLRARSEQVAERLAGERSEERAARLVLEREPEKTPERTRDPDLDLGR